jgi:hypothetical protein
LLGVPIQYLPQLRKIYRLQAIDDFECHTLLKNLFDDSSAHDNYLQLWHLGTRRMQLINIPNALHKPSQVNPRLLVHLHDEVLVLERVTEAFLDSFDCIGFSECLMTLEVGFLEHSHLRKVHQEAVL